MSMAIDNTYMMNYSTEAVDANTDKVKNTISNAETDEEMLKACQEFEAYMIQSMYKNMQETVKMFSEEEENSTGDQYVDMFQDTYLQEICQQMMNSGQGIGIAEQLYESIINQ